MKKKHVVIFSEPNDWSTNDIMDWVIFYNKQPIRTSASEVLNGDFQLDFGTRESSFRYQGERISLKDIHSFWYRRTVQLGLAPLRKDLKIDPENEAAIQHHKFDELKYTRDAFYHLTKEHKWLNSPFNSIIDKSFCLIEAQNCGLRVPDTIITTQKETAAEFYEQNGKEVIIKPIYNVSLLKEKKKNYLQYTTSVTDEMMEQFPETFFPTLFQQKINKQIELRVFYLAGKCYTMAMFTQLNEHTRDDFRMYDSTNPTRTVPYKLPSKLEKKLEKLMKRVNLNSGSIDLILDHEENYFFLEVNPVGQFGMTSYPCNYYIEEEIAKYLTK